MAGGSVATSGTKKKKKGIVKSIAKGLSFKKKKQRPDDDSVVGVALDRGGGNSAAPVAPPPRSVGGTNGSAGNAPSTTTTTTNPTPKPIQVVLLLMDPSSRRSELLQLEFDSSKANVSDVIQQIQCSATESTLRDMKYVGVCDVYGTEMISVMKLSQFCKGNDMVMAIPDGLTGEDTANLAGPILDDPKVEDMVRCFCSILYCSFFFFFCLEGERAKGVDIVTHQNCIIITSVAINTHSNILSDILLNSLPHVE